MRFTTSVVLAVMAALSANAAATPQRARPAGRPAPPAPMFNTQTISCGGAGAPYCCSPSSTQSDNLVGQQGSGTTCSKMSGSVSCNALVVCCNNNAGDQSCSATLATPVIYV